MELNLSILALVDSDPRGFKYFNESDYSDQFEYQMAGDQAWRFGKYKIREECRFPLSKQDIKTLKELLDEDFVKKKSGWVEELEFNAKE